MRKSKQTIRGGKKMKSSLETYCYDRLKEEKLDFKYEEEVFELIPAFVYDGIYHKAMPKKKDMVCYSGKPIRPITYKPDFVSHVHKFVIETKGYVRPNDSFPLRWKLFVQVIKEQYGSDYMLLIPKNREQVDLCIDMIKLNAKK